MVWDRVKFNYKTELVIMHGLMLQEFERKLEWGGNINYGIAHPKSRFDFNRKYLEFIINHNKEISLNIK